MTTLVAQRFNRLTDSLSELKVKVRAVLATELAGAVGSAIRDVLMVALLDRLVDTARSSYSSRSNHGRDKDRPHYDRWEDSRDPWTDEDDRQYTSPRYSRDELDDECSPPRVPVAAVLAVGANVGRWWLARNGSLTVAVGVGVLAMTLGLTGGPIARAILTVLSTATDVLTAEAVLARRNSL